MNNYQKRREAYEDTHTYEVPNSLKKIVRVKAPELSLTPSNVITQTLPSCITKTESIRLWLQELVIDEVAIIEGVHVLCHKSHRKIVYDIKGYGKNWSLDAAVGAISALLLPPAYDDSLTPENGAESEETK